ncbi:DUF6612 family protein [Sporosarcina obsidiansis]|uniref:DUF6612 family protein n=1 Tax=Sporosarcina obsidiansis TaxID=2660748 RepID=UPI00129A1720|nr:DUF6612 family protein [Sporosarcina obsidiansis]
MKKFGRTLILCMSVILFGACSESTDDLTMQEVQTRLDQSTNEVDRYEIDMVLTVLAKDMSRGEQKQVNKGKVQYIEKESPDFHASYITTTDGEPNDAKAEVYKKDNIILTNENGGDWEDISGQVTDEELLSVQYAKMIENLRKVKDELAMKEKEDSYILTYSGNSQDVYKVFKDSFNMSFTGVDSTNISSDLEVVIDKDTMRMKDFNYEAVGKNPTQSVTISVELGYGQVNEVEEIELPKLN